ncbi:hypothetical protein BOX15_Mlig029609g3 [Macrostomum lignano]|uniref:MARVEL domain-containing protein n=1 Tax=Macrostomum lignano TaxID=282301 RepID=A0A267GEQ8_9PLAT|nr:hypothetical protein BOX15_Mlig029609g3 [Macrostomum lignano]
MVTISFHQVAIVTLSSAIVCGLISLFTADFFIKFDVVGFNFIKHKIGYCNATPMGLFDSSATAIKVLLIGGLSCAGCCLLLEFISVTVHSARENASLKALCMIVCFAGSVTLVTALALAKPSSVRPDGVARGYSFLMAAVSCVFTIESLVFYVIQWRCQ